MELARNLRIDSISRLELSGDSLREIESSQTVADAVYLMRQERVGCLLVCQNRRLVGVFTERDLLYRVLNSRSSLSTRLREVMTTNPVTVNLKDSIRTAIKKMQQGGYRHLPVIDEDEKPIGVLSVKSIIHYLVEHYPEAVYNLPPDPGNVPKTAEGA